MPAPGTDYDFDDGVLRELHAAQARRHFAPSARVSPGGGRRLGNRVLLAGGGALTMAAAAAGVAALSSHSPSAPAIAVTSQAPRPQPGISLTAKLSASLGAEAAYMITSRITQDVTREKLTSWIDPVTGNRRLVLENAAGVPITAEGIVVHGASATITTLDYTKRTVTTLTEPTAAVSGAARLGVNVPSPSDIRSELRSATLVSEGQVEVSGHRAYRLRMMVPPRSQAWFPGNDVELYVDASTYLLIRTTISHDGRLLDTDDLTWGPRATADLSQTRVTIPAGFTRR